MYHLPVHMHVPDGHKLAGKLSYVVHDERFWGIVAMILFLALIVALAILANGEGGSPVYPSMPYGP